MIATWSVLEPIFETKKSVFFCTDERKMALPEITASQLALYNGQEKPEIYIAYKGLVYDVSASRLWKNGKHYEHWAGQDLTDELKDAPHAAWVFDRFDAVAILQG